MYASAGTRIDRKDLVMIRSDPEVMAIVLD